MKTEILNNLLLENRIKVARFKRKARILKNKRYNINTLMLQ